ncbi:MAG TPA: alpha-L-arabinofuranosidase C-terminal domain-containing protein [Anaeromyxobacteraceae bacterium]|nr:alpha-L-arabinofuranosidase C-terminal domain-containing protein [Anaeromyxobacteraceae bacterium]
MTSKIWTRIAALGFLLGVAAPRAGAQDATSSITVAFGSVQRPVPALMFGQNLETVNNGNGLVRPDGTFDQGIMALLSEARVTSLRYPGGTAADYLHWWQAVGPFSSRPQQSQGYLNENYTPLAGPDEFIRAAIALRATSFVVANTGTGTSDEAAAFATFFASRGFPAAFWEIGNEIYFEGITANGLAGLPPDTYGQKVIEYAAAIRKAAPGAKVCAAGVVGPEQQSSYWNAVVLGIAGPYIDGVTLHNAYFPLYGYLPDGTVPPDAYLYTAMLASTQAVELSLSVVEGQLESLGVPIPIFVTEYDGIFYPNASIEDVSVTLRRNQTLSCALFNASVLNLFLRHSRVQGAHHMAMAGSEYGSLVGVDGASQFRNPQFYVHKEYAREAGNLVVQTTVDPQTGVFSSGPIALLSAQSNVPMLDAVATRSGDGRRYALFVVNRSLTTAVSTRVQVDRGVPAAGTATVLTGPTFDARNSAQNPLLVSPVTRPVGVSASFSYRFPPYSLTILRWTH